MRFAFALALFTFASPAFALEPADVFVVANRAVPVSREVGEHYLAKRNVPKDHLILLDLPTTKDISRADYDTKMVAPLREFLKERKGKPTVILTVYGVPLRVGRQELTADEKAALARLQVELEAARKLEADHKNDKTADPKEVAANKQKILEMEFRRRRLAHDESLAAVDSELMLLWWDKYPLDRWVLNPLNWQVHDNHRASVPPVVMTSRLDGPSAEIAKRLVDDAVAVEATGLSGIAVIDSRDNRFDPFKDGEAGYGAYDESMRETARLLERTGLKVHSDEKPEVLPAGSVKGVALYCGWYSHANFVDCCEYERGAIAWHLASSEAVTLRNRDSKVWCPNLLKKGVAATLGPVSEPYTLGFPKPAEFFGSLVTGKFTLVESYSRTMVTCSWMTVLVGDPLYNPYKVKPLLRVDDILPSPRRWLRK